MLLLHLAAVSQLRWSVRWPQPGWVALDLYVDPTQCQELIEHLLDGDQPATAEIVDFAWLALA